MSDMPENTENTEGDDKHPESAPAPIATPDGSDVRDDYDVVTKPLMVGERQHQPVIPQPVTAIVAAELAEAEVDEEEAIASLRHLDVSDIDEDFGISYTGRTFQNKVKHKDNEIRPKMVRIKPVRGNPTAEQAAQMASNYSDATHSSVPLPYTGIWLTMKAPSELERFNFQQKLASIEDGESLMGVAMSETHIRILRKIHTMNFVIDNISGSNLDFVPDDWAEVLRSQDLDVITTYLAGNTYTRGYDYNFRCFNGECNHIEPRKIFPLRLVQFDFDDILTPMQLGMLADSKRKVSAEQLKQYQDEFKLVKNAYSETQFGEGEEARYIRVDFQNPNFNDYIANGRAWMSAVDAELMRTVLDTATVAEKKKYLRERVAREPMAEKVFRVAQIQHGQRDEDGNFVNDPVTAPDAIAAFFKGLGSSNLAVINAVNDLERYLLNTLLYSVGIPNHKCPKCQKRQQAGQGKFRDRIAMNAETLFTYALYQSLATKAR